MTSRQWVQLDLDLGPEGLVDQVGSWDLLVIRVRGPWYCGIEWAARVVHKSGADLVPGWRICPMSIDAAFREVHRLAAYLRRT